jgi:hypothetical protein
MPNRRILWLAGLALFVAGCMNLDAKKLEDNIKDTLKEKDVTLKSLTCPKDRKMKNGDKFTCDGETEEGDKVVFDVEQTSSSGDIKWNLRGAIIQADDLGDSIEAKIGETADVKCPDKAMILPKGKKITCDVVIEGKKDKVQLKAVDDKGTVDWKLASAKGDDDDDDDDKGDGKKKKKSGDDDDDDDDKPKKKKKSKGDDDDD